MKRRNVLVITQHHPEPKFKLLYSAMIDVPDSVNIKDCKPWVNDQVALFTKEFHKKHPESNHYQFHGFVHSLSEDTYEYWKNLANKKG